MDASLIFGTLNKRLYMESSITALKKLIFSNTIDDFIRDFNFIEFIMIGISAC